MYVRVNLGNAETSKDYKIIIVYLSLETTFCWILTAGHKFAVSCLHLLSPLARFITLRSFYYLASLSIPEGFYRAFIFGPSFQTLITVFVVQYTGFMNSNARGL